MNGSPVLCWALALALPACGYQVIRGDAPFGMHRIAVMPFAENVPLGLAGPLADNLVRLLAHDGVDVAPSGGQAQAVLRGTILASSTAGSPTAGIGARIPAYGLTVRLRAKLVNHAGKTLWQDIIAVREDFLPSTQTDANDALATEANRRRSLMRLAQTAAEAVNRRLRLAGSLPAEKN